MRTFSFFACLLVTPLLTSAQDTYPPGTVLVVAPTQYPFAGVEIGGEFSGSVVVETSLIQTMAVARQNPNVQGVIDVIIDAESLYERGSVTCYAINGKKRWVEKVMFNMGGGAAKIAEKFSAKLAEKVRGKTCP